MEKPVIVHEKEHLDGVSYSNLFASMVVKGSEEEKQDHYMATIDEFSTNVEKEASFSPPITRHAKNGAWTFKENSEYELMIHVQQGLDSFDFKHLNEVESANVILDSVDGYCLGKQWMFHIGKEKGLVLKGFLRRCIENYLSTQGKNDDSQHQQLNIVELGTYCGYSAILLAKTVREYFPSLNFHVYSTEVNQRNVQVANTMILMAKLQPYITVILLEPSVHTLSKVLAKHLGKVSAKIDFLFLDHAKSLYLENLQELENAGNIRQGTFVAADNVIVNRSLIMGYRRHLQTYSRNGIVETKLVELKLEYSDDIKDGIGA